MLKCTLGGQSTKIGSTSPRKQTSAPHLLSPIAMLMAGLASGYIPYPAHAQSIVATGDVNPAVPSPPPAVWNVGARLFVGRTGHGTLSITEGAIVNYSNAFVGDQSGSNGVLTVSGAGSTSRGLGNLYIGNFGSGTLTVSEGGQVSGDDGVIADNAGSTGSATVSGVGSSWVNKHDLMVATSGVGTLTIEDGGRVSADFSIVGLDSSGDGRVTVSGAGSIWTNSTGLTVGDSGSGTLDIQNGGTVSSGFAELGNFFGGNGSATVTGAGSTWDNSSALTIGNGSTGTLTLAEGGNVSVQGGAGSVGLGVFNSANGTLNIGAASANPADATAAGTLNTATLAFGDGAGTLNFNHTDSRYTFATVLTSSGTGTHSINHFAGTTLLNADNSGFTGTKAVAGGTLVVANQLGGSASVTGGRLQVDGIFAGPIAIAQAGTLAGVGTVTGAATFANGGALVGTQGQTLKFGGDLTLNNASQINVALGGAATPALFDVAGALTLDGALNISSQGGFGQGVYRLFDYQGTLTDNTMDIGTTPSGVASADLLVQTGIGQVNLIYTGGATLNFWDGGTRALHNNAVVDGGDGVWSASDSNWTTVDGAINGPFLPNPNFAVFQGAGGTVTVDNTLGLIGVTGLQIASDGYRIEGNEIALQGGSESIIRIGDSSAASASMTGTINANLSGASTLVKTDFGTLVLAGTNSYSGGTDIRGGVLAVSSDTNLGEASGAIILNGGALASTASFTSSRTVNLAQQGEINVAGNTELTLSGSVEGSGELYKSGAGTLVLTGANNYADTRVEAGSLIGNTNSLSGNLLNNATVIFDQQADANYAGQITGRGSITKRGSGELTLSGSSRHIWRIEDGTLISNADRYLGNTQLDSAGTLRFEQTSDATYAGVLSGSGAFAKTGAGQLNLTGNSSTFTGHTQVQRGTLAMGDQGQLGGTLTIANGATLQGTGRVGTTLLQNGATVSPGNSIGTLKVAGDLVFSPESIYHVEADPNTAASDRIDVTQTANLAGSVVHVGPEGRFASTREYTILTANSVQGRFATISSNFAFLDPTLRYSAQDVKMLLVRKDAGGSFVDAAQTENQRATASGLDSLPADNPLYEYIVTLPAGAPPAVFDNLSGELHASVAAGLLGSSTTLSSLPLSRLHTKLQSGAATTSSNDSRTSSTQRATSDQPVWAEVVGNWRIQQDDGNAAQVKQHSGGLFVGTDHAIGDGWQWGGALGYTSGELSVDHRASKADLSNYSTVLFGGKSFEAGTGKLNLLGGAAYTWHDIDTRRYANVSGASQSLTADYSANTAQLFTELGYVIPLAEHMNIEPFAGLSWNYSHIDGFSESGGSAALSGQSSSEKQTSTTLGVRAKTPVSLEQVDGQLSATLGWQHALSDVVAHRTMAFNGSQYFTVASAPLARNAALVELGADVALTSTTALGLIYRGQYGEGNTEHTGMLTLSWNY